MKDMRKRSVHAAMAMAAIMISAVFLAIPFWSNGSDAATPYDDVYRDSLTPDGKRLYDGLVTNASNINLDQFTVNLDNVPDSDLVSQALHAFRWSNPEFFWVDHIECTVDDTKVKVRLVTISSLDGSADKKAAIENMYSDIDKAVSKFVTSGGLRYDLIKGMHDRIVNTTRYDTAAAADSDSNPNAFNIYGVFVEGRAVCQGYALAMYYLCDIADIPCMNIVGLGKTSSGTEGHMWNYIMMDDGLWYCMDATWDDPIVSDGSDMLRYDYFLVGADSVSSGKTFLESHVPDYSGALSIFEDAIPKTTYSEPKKLSDKDFLIRPGSEGSTLLIGNSGDGAYTLQRDLIDPSSSDNILWKIGSSGKGAIMAGGMMFILSEKDLEALCSHMVSEGTDTVTFDSSVRTVPMERPLLSPIDRTLYTPIVKDGNGTVYTDLSDISADMSMEIGIPYEKELLDIDMLLFLWELDDQGKAYRIDMERYDNGYAVAKVDKLSGYYVASNNYFQLSPLLMAIIALGVLSTLIVVIRAVISLRRKKKRKNSRRHKH